MSKDIKKLALDRLASAMKTCADGPTCLSSNGEVFEQMQVSEAMYLASMFQDWKAVVFGTLVSHLDADKEAHWARLQPTPFELAEEYESRAIELFSESSAPMMDRLRAVDLLMRAEALRCLSEL